MKIEKLDSKTVKVSLSSYDLENFHITYEEMDYSDDNTKRAILSIVRQIKSQTGLPVDTVKLFIEAFPNEDDGCILYINLMNPIGKNDPLKQERYSFDTPLILGFDDLETLTDASHRVLHDFGHLIIKSALYLYEDKYRLLLYTYCKMEKKIISLLKEYGVYMGKGSILCAFIKEHSKPICKERALETIVKYLG